MAVRCSEVELGWLVVVVPLLLEPLLADPLLLDPLLLDPLLLDPVDEGCEGCDGAPGRCVYPPFSTRPCEDCVPLVTITTGG